MAYAAESHLLITDLDQSRFNVGTQIKLRDFTAEETAELNRRHGEPLRDAQELARLLTLIGGHPYLLQRSLHELKIGHTDLAGIEAKADHEAGLFSSHLRRIARLVSHAPEYREVVWALLDGGTIRDDDTFSKLCSAGVLAGDSAEEARFRCDLYARYFRRRLP